jgi:hypothetical protein
LTGWLNLVPNAAIAGVFAVSLTGIVGAIGHFLSFGKARRRERAGVGMKPSADAPRDPETGERLEPD